MKKFLIALLAVVGFAAPLAVAVSSTPASATVHCTGVSKVLKPTYQGGGVWGGWYQCGTRGQITSNSSFVPAGVNVIGMEVFDYTGNYAICYGATGCTAFAWGDHVLRTVLTVLTSWGAVQHYWSPPAYT